MEAAGQDETLDAPLASAPPQASEAEAERVALTEFGVVGRARRLTSERDLNFALALPDGTARVLKFANADDAAEILDFQLAALEHVAAVAPDIPVPRVVRTRLGSRLAGAPDAHGQRHHVFMLGYLAGRPFSPGSAPPCVTSIIRRPAAHCSGT
jgi:hydroxylysine kinase